MALYGKIKAKLVGKPFCTMVVLAAGSSKRMGRDKLMMEVGGVPVLVRSLQAMQTCAAVDELIVVTRTSRLEEIAALTAIQTPQVFQADLIKAALTNAMRKHLAITDDCSAVEQLRVKPVVTQGSDENLKITTPIDIELAESILRRRGGA